MSLVAELDLGRPGRRAESLTAEVDRELTPDDLSRLTVNRGTQPVSIKSLRARHHALARCIAAGMRDYEASAATGYTPSRISILRDDPMFQDLVQFYRDDVDAQYVDLHQRLSHLSLAAAEELLERLEDNPESVSVGQLNDLLKSGADRTGYGPQTKSQNTHVHVVNIADRLDAARKRVADRAVLELDANPPAVVDGPDGS